MPSCCIGPWRTIAPPSSERGSRHGSAPSLRNPNSPPKASGRGNTERFTSISWSTDLHDHERHREFLNRYYGLARWVYDVTRHYYLAGRDRAIGELMEERWGSLVEIGVGTGRNLRKIHKQRPDAFLGGIDASDEMVKHARRTCPWATIAQGFAEHADYTTLLGRKPERVLFSYSLSMVQDAEAALANARKSLAPGDESLS